jgi:sulfur transfer protein SufE
MQTTEEDGIIAALLTAEIKEVTIKNQAKFIKNWQKNWVTLFMTGLKLKPLPPKNRN